MYYCTTFKKLMTKGLLPAGALMLSLSLTNCTTEYKKYEGDLNKQVASIIRENGCLQCHSPEAALPFYGKFPVIGATVKADMVDGTRYLNLDGLLEALDNGGDILETDMAKVENTALTGSMPPFKYYAMPIHWGTKLSSDEKKTIIAWAKETRKKYFTSPTVAPEFANEPLQPLPASLPTDPAKVQLGYELFHDTRLSADNTISCASCHGLETGGVDRKQFSEGISGQFGGVNAPTVYNSALNFIQFWDGRAADLKEQAAGPPLNPVEMGHESFDNIVANLLEDKEFTKRFTEVYPDGLSETNITDAIAEFEMTLLTPSRFDQYLRGDKNALTAYEIEGYEQFKEHRCATCHVGMNIGGQSFEYMGIKGNYFDYRAIGLTDGDQGRFAFTGLDLDMHRFKTPTLRNVMITYPYMHDGTLTTIEDAVRVMHKFQIGHDVNDDEMAKIVAFLHTLTGEYNGELLN